VLAPGNAIDLGTRVAVTGRPSPRRRFYLTDVTVTHATALQLVAVFQPGVAIVGRDAVVPRGLGSRRYDRILVDAMQESQHVAAFVAERAAGLAVPAAGADGLPVPVHFALDDVSGSSGGLMLALDIFAALANARYGSAVAGTGALAIDGRVERVEGVRQKFIAAERAGARTFLVPRANAGDVTSDAQVIVVPVDTFAQAAAVLGVRAPSGQTGGA